MAKINIEKIKALAIEYISNGYCKEKALLAIGYKPSYAHSGLGMKIYEDIRLKAEIERLQAKTALKTDITIAHIQSEHERLAALAEAKGDLSTATRNLELLGKTIAAYKDTLQTSDLDKAKELSESEAVEAKRIASIRLSDVMQQAIG